MCFELKEARTNVITVSVGKEYLYSIVGSFPLSKEEKGRLYKEVDYFINSISSKDFINYFILNKDLYYFFHSDEKVEELVKSLRGLENEFQYSFLFNHIKRMYNYFIDDKIREQVHLYFQLSSKEPERKFSLDEDTVNYDSIQCKFKLKNYIKYTNRTRTCAEGWTYQICLLYLIIINKLYELLKPHIDDIEDFLVICFTNINPVIVGFTSTLGYDLGEFKALDLMQEFFELHSTSDDLIIKYHLSKQAIEFLYSSEDWNFKSSFESHKKAKYKCDSSGKRTINLYISGEENTLSLRINIIGLNAINDITGLSVNKILYDFVTYDKYLDCVGYKVLKIMLSNTLEHKNAFQHACKIVKGSNYSYAFGSKRDNVRYERKTLTINNAFKELKQDHTSFVAERMIEEFKLKRYQMDYVIIAFELAKKEDNVISKYLTNLGSKQQACFRKIIKYIKGYNSLQKLNLINEIYRKVSYVC